MLCRNTIPIITELIKIIFKLYLHLLILFTEFNLYVSCNLYIMYKLYFNFRRKTFCDPILKLT